MKTPDKLTGMLLDKTVDLMFRIHMMRADCSAAAQTLLTRNNRDHTALNGCAQIDESLAKVYRTLQRTVRSVQAARATRRRRACE